MVQIRRTKDIPPYEVMKPRDTGWSESESMDQGESRIESGVDRKPFNWVVRARHPFVVRIPFGYALLLVGALFGVVLLAYWVGQSRGYRAAELELRHSRGHLPSARTPGGGTVVDAPELADPRTPGHHYFDLADYPEDDARRLIEFLQANGVDAAAFRRNNRSLVRVIALQGFTGEQISRDEHRAYEKQLRVLGHRWKDLHDGANHLEELQLKLYQGSQGITGP